MPGWEELKAGVVAQRASILTMSMFNMLSGGDKVTVTVTEKSADTTAVQVSSYGKGQVGPDFGRNNKSVRLVLEALETDPALQDTSSKDFVLENMLLAKTAFDAHEWQTAKQGFKRVIDFYETFSEQQKRAGNTSLAEKEIRRFFKGEPFERAFVFFYYGLLHLMEGDAQEGGRSLYSAIAADAAFSEAYGHDNALFYFFLGHAYLEKHDFGNAAGAFRNCSRLLREQGNPLSSQQRITLGLPQEESDTPDTLQKSAKPNVIVLIELGYSPNKATEGAQNQQWRYYPLPCRAKSANYYDKMQSSDNSTWSTEKLVEPKTAGFPFTSYFRTRTALGTGLICKSCFMTKTGVQLRRPLGR